MIVRKIEAGEREVYNASVKHPLQSWEWGEFRKKTGVAVERVGFFEKEKLNYGIQVSFHPIPHTSYTAGYFPRSPMPDKEQLDALRELGKQHKAIYIKLEPNVRLPVGTPSAHESVKIFLTENGCQPGRPLFAKYTFVLDISKSEEELLENMKPKTRYNINLASRKGVQIVEDSTEAGLEEYLKVLKETTRRQGFYAHSENYFRTMWKELAPAGVVHILKAVLDGKTLAVWVLFVWNGVLYYPYGASTSEHKDVMASNLLMWEAIRFGKRHTCTSFDMWGALGPDASDKDPWYGFHKFKEGYGGTLMQFVGSYDLVLNPRMYKIYRAVENLRWKVLRWKAGFFR